MQIHTHRYINKWGPSQQGSDGPALIGPPVPRWAGWPDSSGLGSDGPNSVSRALVATPWP